MAMRVAFEARSFSRQPNVTSSGDSATATITPIYVADTPAANASAPAQPEANATATSPSSTPLREATSGV
ncbi:MAG: hypothetical protein ACM338_09070, partial [Betaproteobacteria bacterium]